MVNYYTILRVSETATREEIRDAYRRLALEFHPDRNPDNPIAEEYIRLINEAYDVLGEPVKRNWYDMLLKRNGLGTATDPRKYGTHKRYTRKQPTAPPPEIPVLTPFWLRFGAPGIGMIWGFMLLYNNWFATLDGFEHLKVVIGFLIYGACSYFLVNAFYINWQIRQIKTGVNFNPENHSLFIYLLLLLTLIPIIWGTGVIRKNYQLKNYALYTEASILKFSYTIGGGELQVSYVDRLGEKYTKKFQVNSPVPLDAGNATVMVKYSAVEPRIVQCYIRLKGKDGAQQVIIDEMNKGNDYFSMP